MKKLTVKNLVEFRSKSTRSKQIFVDNLKSIKVEIPSEGGGDYWVSSVSTVSKSYKQDDLKITSDKIEVLHEKIKQANDDRIKDMFNRNILVLKKYPTLDLKKLRPSKGYTFLKKSTANSLLTIKGIQIKVQPNHIFTFKKGGVDEVGAIWFIARLKAYRDEELGIFVDLLFRFLKSNYSGKYSISKQHCSVVDVLKGATVSYSQIDSGEIPSVLIPTIDEISRMM